MPGGAHRGVYEPALRRTGPADPDGPHAELQPGPEHTPCVHARNNDSPGPGDAPAPHPCGVVSRLVGPAPIRRSPWCRGGGRVGLGGPLTGRRPPPQRSEHESHGRAGRTDQGQGRGQGPGGDAVCAHRPSVAKGAGPQFRGGRGTGEEGGGPAVLPPEHRLGTGPRPAHAIPAQADSGPSDSHPGGVVRGGRAGTADPSASYGPPQRGPPHGIPVDARVGEELLQTAVAIEGDRRRVGAGLEPAVDMDGGAQEAGRCGAGG